MNVQQTIIKGIRELLFFHNYLVLPDFGGFVLKTSPAHIGSSQILPPAKTISFNAQLRQNDGLLASWLQEKLSCTAPQALAHLHDFTGYCSHVLSARRRLTLEQIGFFYLDFENNICFEPQADSNFLMASFGLGPVALRQIETPINEPKRQPVFADRKPEPALAQPVVKQQRSYKQLAVPLAFSALLFSLLVLFIANTRLTGQFRASVFGHGASYAYQPIAYPELNLLSLDKKTSAYVTDANGIAALEPDGETSIAVKVMDKTPLTVNDHYHVPVKHNGRFEIVLGCFTVLENASRMTAKLTHKQIAAEISGKNEKGMYVVSNGSFDTREEAIQQIQTLKQDFPNAWIRKR